MKPIYHDHAVYLRRVFNEPEAIAKEVARTLDSVHFDSFVVTGLSGCLIVDRIARALGKPYAVVRKDDGAHSGRLVEGTLGQRWVFLDDFIASGRTFMQVCKAISIVTSVSTCVGACYYEPRGTRKLLN